MKKNVVKKSIFGRFLNMILPFYCRGCGKAGNLLCEHCKSNIGRIGEAVNGVVPEPVLPGRRDEKGVPGRRAMKTVELSGIDRLFIGGVRTGALKKLVEDYKFKSTKAASEILVEMIDGVVPEELGEVVVVPLPTIRKHIRERGFDHTKRLAEEFTRGRSWKTVSVLKRMNKTVQVGADEETRKKQAEKAYAVDIEVARAAGLMKDERLRTDVTYLLLDDVWTTGSSMRAAAKKLREGGAKQVLAVAVCINSLD